MKKNSSAIKKILLVSIVIIAATAFLIIRQITPNKDEKKLISYLEEHDYNSLKLNCAAVDKSSINIQFAISKRDGFLEEAMDVKNRVENFTDCEEYRKHKVSVIFTFDGIVAVELSNRPDYANFGSDIPQGRRYNNELINVIIYCSQCSDLSPLKDCFNIKVLEVYGLRKSEQVAVIKDMKELTHIYVCLDDDPDRRISNKIELKKELQETHHDCVVEVK
ncbi:MAG: hypothetical protein GXY08_01370 [Ruminococcus sp.]|nr:hypothetical protein [Ruminococcus sp.]